jgi:hypothetical protein
MARNKPATNFDIRIAALRAGGWGVSTWSPGDGATRYRFHLPGKPHDYFEDGGVFTALGRKEADTFARGVIASRQDPTLARRIV